MERASPHTIVAPLIRTPIEWAAKQVTTFGIALEEETAATRRSPGVPDGQEPVWLL